MFGAWPWHFMLGALLLVVFLGACGTAPARARFGQAFPAQHGQLLAFLLAPRGLTFTGVWCLVLDWARWAPVGESSSWGLCSLTPKPGAES